MNRRELGHATINIYLYSNIPFRDYIYKKTVVLAIIKDNIDTLLTLFKIYDSSAAFNNSTL
ncbi:Acyl transferase/acyl hydrolase/lysophospholipase [Penicillium desertorum]|uniref:Acyl transferase/acyl hydrolase/lysophospholipase n=1 Tax=Penicillium desertorum TaxID=1303715 RepID=A0A9W9WHU2_9EURO|nr:Acyl transferase/acyl hydrolase/lysophospholipase [Penicillium desertorum]